MATPVQQAHNTKMEYMQFESMCIFLHHYTDDWTSLVCTPVVVVQAWIGKAYHWPWMHIPQAGMAPHQADPSAESLHCSVGIAAAAGRPSAPL